MNFLHENASLATLAAKSKLLRNARAVRIRCLLALLALMFVGAEYAFALELVHVQAGDEAALIQAVELANISDEAVAVVIEPNPDGDSEFVFEGPYGTSGAALPELTGDLQIGPSQYLEDPVVIRSGENAFWDFRFINVVGTGRLRIRGEERISPSGTDLLPIEIFGFAALNGSGGAISFQDMSRGSFSHVRFERNLAAGNGGAVAAEGSAKLDFHFCEFRRNVASSNGGAFSLVDNSSATVRFCRFVGGETSLKGCYVYVNSSGTGAFAATLRLSYSVFAGSAEECHDELVEGPMGDIRFDHNTFSDGGNASIGSVSAAKALGNLFDTPSQQQLQHVVSGKISGTEAACEGGGIESLGYNISPDNSCGLDHPTDLPNTNPMVALNADGIPVPQAGSPAIDGGAVDSMVIGDDDLASLPCGYVDVLGTARPQDGNGDGVFECDMGAVEIAGTGDVTDGHSGAFFNVNRDGEGTYVEILNGTTAVVYTFTYRPDGSGPAWFIGVGRIEGNSIIIDELLRPIGSSFGTGFDPDDVEFTPIGGMSMVFPDCEAANPGGNVAYSGDVELGYEGLITRATRLSNITGCGLETPHSNAGLSGSYFDPARDGEGIIVEWLTSGQVLVVFFTYDQDGNQLWLIGIGTPDGNRVAMDALYASTYTQWGRGFNSNDVTISNWGTFLLVWSECNAVTFDYDSTVPGFGSASRHYVRLSTLQNTQCPQF